jgi:hypothetical protein
VQCAVRDVARASTKAEWDSVRSTPGGSDPKTAKPKRALSPGHGPRQKRLSVHSRMRCVAATKRAVQALSRDPWMASLIGKRPKKSGPPFSTRSASRLQHPHPGAASDTDTNHNNPPIPIPNPNPEKCSAAVSLTRPHYCHAVNWLLTSCSPTPPSLDRGDPRRRGRSQLHPPARPRCCRRALPLYVLIHSGDIPSPLSSNPT